MPKNDDLQWLYREDPRDEPEHTAILSPETSQAYPTHQSSAQSGRVPTSPPPIAPPAARGSVRTRRRRHPVLRTVAALVALWLAFLLGTPAYAWSVTTKVDAVPDGERPGEQPGTTVLLVGSDAREGDAGRADTMMLLHVPVAAKPVLMSLPRDSLVAIPGRNRNKINAAYAFGGPQLLVATVEENTGVRVDGYLEVGFDGVVQVVDAVGGIEVCPTFDIDDSFADLTLSQGCQMVDGTTALAYSRMRKSDPKGDLGRVERQREVIAAIMKEALSPASLINPLRYWRLNMAAAESLSRGEDTGLLDMGAVGLGFAAATTGAGISMTVPVAGTDTVDGVGSVVRWDEDASSAVFAAIASGDTSDLDKYQS
ncbi:LCP family protein [Tessaracoccus sp. Z1128]